MSAIDVHYDQIAPLYAEPSSRTRARLRPLFELTAAHAMEARDAIEAFGEEHPEYDLAPTQADFLALINRLNELRPQLIPDGATLDEPHRWDDLDPDELVPDAWEHLVNRGQLWVPLAVVPAALLERLDILAEHDQQHTLIASLKARLADVKDTVKDTIDKTATASRWGLGILLAGVAAAALYYIAKD